MSTPPAPRRSGRIKINEAVGKFTTALVDAPLSTSSSATPASAPSSTSPSPTRQHPAASMQLLPREFPDLSERLPFVIDWDDPTQEIHKGDTQAVAMAFGRTPSSAVMSSDTHSAHLSAYVFAPSSPTTAIDPMGYETTLMADDIRDKLRKALPTRWVRRYCIVRPDAKRDHLIEVIMASTNVLSAINKVCEAASKRRLGKILEQLVGELGNAFRSELLTMRRKPDTSYGKFASRGTRQMQSVRASSGSDFCHPRSNADADWQAPLPQPTIGDDETYRADLVVQEVDPTPAMDGEVLYNWGQVMSFVEVKREGRQDGKDDIAVQGTQYVVSGKGRRDPA